MIAARWLSSLKAFVSPQPSSIVPEVLARDEFRRLIARERSRADRVVSELSLVVLDLSHANWRDLQPAEFLFAIQGRVRETDAVGWFDRKSLGILLPDTSSVGAYKVATDLRERLHWSPSQASWRIYTYPRERFPDQESDDHDDRFEMRSTKARGWFGQGSAARAARTDSAPRRTPTRLQSVASPDYLAAEQGIDTPEPIAPIEFGALNTVLEPRRSRLARCFDVAASALGLVLVSPVLLVAGVAIKLTSPGPMFFRQQRMGQGGRPFSFYKLRTMCADAEARKKDLMSLNEQSGPVFKVTRDPRITPVGRILRKTSIDELPQLWNVLKGDMTLVGPRPPLPAEVAEYERWQRRRLDIAGGLTCIWQISGRSTIQFDDWVRMDLRYARASNWWLDLKILALTVPAVVTGRGAR
jgi:lipopolysaccharide/colanic/teichoic acid biosynthesis glycosyltransferase